MINISELVCRDFAHRSCRDVVVRDLLVHGALVEGVRHDHAHRPAGHQELPIARSIYIGFAIAVNVRP
eukprot:3009953-Pyramimonas_sp.AAC.1